MPHVSSNLPWVLVLVGPTCSGKTDVSLILARRINGEIVSADSRQIYRYLDIGTAKPTTEERAMIPHHFVDARNPDELFTAGEFGIEGRKVIDAIVGRRRVPIVVGGSGLYVRSLIDGLFEGPGPDPEIRELLEQKVERGLVSELLSELSRIDPETAARVGITKPRRIIRALEVYYLTGKPISTHHREAKPDIRIKPAFFGLSWNRKELYRRIEERCERMLAGGLEREVEQLKELGFNRRLRALNTVGYAEVFAYQEGEIDRNEMLRLFKQNSRRYAKRQLTWFRRDERIRWIEMDEGRQAEEVAAEIERWTRRDE